MVPIASYTIWFSQRTGSSFLATELEQTGIAGIPHEWLLTPEGVSLLEHYDAKDGEEFVAALHRLGMTGNGVFGAKISWYEPRMSEAFALLRQLPGCPEGATRPELWEYAFPNHHHIFMTRRNKVRLAVSWWRAIRSGEWHLRVDAKDPRPRRLPDIEADYNFDAIDALVSEAVMREAGIQAFFTEGKLQPQTIVYEDFVEDYDRVGRRLLYSLGLDPMMTIEKPPFRPTADAIAEAWVQRYREERQVGWKYRGW
jgi:trehalose 2-sulfotransferase